MSDKAKSPDGASCYFLLVALLMLRVFDAGFDQNCQVVLLSCLFIQRLRVFGSRNHSIMTQSPTLNDLLDWIQTADEGKSPGVSDLHVDVGL